MDHQSGWLGERRRGSALTRYARGASTVTAHARPLREHGGQAGTAARARAPARRLRGSAGRRQLQVLQLDAKGACFLSLLEPEMTKVKRHVSHRIPGLSTVQIASPRELDVIAKRHRK